MIYTVQVALVCAGSISAVAAAVLLPSANGPRSRRKFDLSGANFGGEAMQENDAVWMWSESFGEAVERAMLDRPLDPAERLDWPKFCERLTQWWRDVEEARKEYLEGHPAQLRNLYNFWRNVGREDVREQAMLARHSYPRFRLWGWRARAALSNHR